MTRTAMFADGDRHGTPLDFSDAQVLKMVPDFLTQRRLGLKKPTKGQPVKSFHWNQFFIVGAKKEVLVEVRNADLVLTALGTSDFLAVVTEHWKAEDFLFRIAVFHDSTRLEELEDIGRNYLDRCESQYKMSWSRRFEMGNFDAINRALIVPYGKFRHCPTFE